MTPAKLNERIRKGEIWYWTEIAQVNGIVRKAWSRKGAVMIKTDAGNLKVNSVRQACTNEWISLSAEGPLTRAIN